MRLFFCSVFCFAERSLICEEICSCKYCKGNQREGEHKIYLRRGKRGCLGIGVDKIVNLKEICVEKLMPAVEIKASRYVGDFQDNPAYEKWGGHYSSDCKCGRRTCFCAVGALGAESLFCAVKGKINSEAYEDSCGADCAY